MGMELEMERYYDERDYEIGGMFYEGPVDVIDEDDVEYDDNKDNEF